jgi:hypothetical protein
MSTRKFKLSRRKTAVIWPMAAIWVLEDGCPSLASGRSKYLCSMGAANVAVDGAKNMIHHRSTPEASTIKPSQMKTEPNLQCTC